MDECSKTFCTLDRIVNRQPDLNIKESKESATRFLNEIYDRGLANKNFNFVSSLEVNDALGSFNKFYQERYLYNVKSNKSNS